MWNNGLPDREGDGAEGENPDENRREAAAAAAAHMAQFGVGAVAHGHGHGHGGMNLGSTSNFGGFDAFHAYTHAQPSGVSLYPAHHHSMDASNLTMSVQDQRHLLQQQQQLQQLEFTRQQLQYVRQQEEARVAQIAEQRRLQEERAEQRRRHETNTTDSDPDLEIYMTADAQEPAPAAPPRARGKPEALAIQLAARIREEAERNQSAPQDDSKPAAFEAKPPATERTPQPKKNKRKSSSSPRKRTPSGPTVSMDDPVPTITDPEYRNVDALMKQFCRVPLLAEFSRPVALLHPELMSVYTKIIAHPIDLGRVCRNIRRRSYKDTRAIRIDMWRIFMNCAVYHTHPTNKDAVPSFVSISLHLRDYFNALWQEYMIPSDQAPAPAGGKSLRTSSAHALNAAQEKRDEDRKKRLQSTASTILSTRTIEKTAAAIGRFVQSGGKVDDLDTEPILGDGIVEDEEGDLDVVSHNFRALEKRLGQIAQSEEEYNVEGLVRDVRKCYMSDDLFENKPSLRIRFGQRVDRLLGQIIVPIYETGSRGVNQSSVWGCMAAAVWARESSKKPYWPALVLGIMAPDDQKEAWHALLTERNEQRLPQKLLAELQAGKRKAVQALRRQKTIGTDQMSFFLVEFMGTHEFIWVKESDIIETFDPDEDPNLAAAAGNITKKKRSSRSHDVANSKTFALALDEGRWALEEFELQLDDACGDLTEDEDEGQEGEQEVNYSYAVLCQSDEEADEDASGFEHDRASERALTASELEEANELLASDGLLDFTSEGRKNAKKRAAALKKQKASEQKAALRKEKSKVVKASQKSKSSQKKVKGTKEDLKEQRELDRMRKKRSREREKYLKEESRKAKKRRISAFDGDTKTVNPEEIETRRGRANAIVRGYLTRLTKSDDTKNLSIGSMMTIPSSALDSTGLLGMALAFRAAAGHVDFQDSGDQPPKPKPWDAIDVDSATTSAERMKNLKKQAELLEAEIRRVKEATAERRRLTAIAVKEREEKELLVIANATAARHLINQRSKKKGKTPAKSKAVPDEAPSSDIDLKREQEVLEVPVVDSAEEDGTTESLTAPHPATGAEGLCDAGADPTQQDHN